MKRKIILTVTSLMLILGITAGCSTEAENDPVQPEKQTVIFTDEPTESSTAENPVADESEETKDEPTEESSTDGGIDVDLSLLSSTMVYSEVYNIITNPDKYRSKTIKMTGYCSSYYSSLTKEMVYSCIIPDATACCSQGIQFQLTEGYEYPDNGEKITIIGTFDTYEAEPFSYPVITNSQLV